MCTPSIKAERFLKVLYGIFDHYVSITTLTKRRFKNMQDRFVSDPKQFWSLSGSKKDVSCFQHSTSITNFQWVPKTNGILYTFTEHIMSNLMDKQRDLLLDLNKHYLTIKAKEDIQQELDLRFSTNPSFRIQTTNYPELVSSTTLYKYTKSNKWRNGKQYNLITQIISRNQIEMQKNWVYSTKMDYKMVWNIGFIQIRCGMDEGFMKMQTLIASQ